MMNEKIIAVLKNLEVEVDEIEILDDNTITIDGDEFKVLTEEESEQEFYDYQENLWEEMGLQSFSDWAREHIINNFVDEEHLEDIITELNENYIEDIKHEEGRLEEEIEENDCEDEEEYLEYLNENIGDKAQYLIDNFGMEQFTEMVKDNINFDEVVEYIEECDGRGCIASYDGEEREEEVNGEIYFIYQIG